MPFFSQERLPPLVRVRPTELILGQAPFSETFLYRTLGKKDTRTVLARPYALLRAANIEDVWRFEYQSAARSPCTLDEYSPVWNNDAMSDVDWREAARAVGIEIKELSSGYLRAQGQGPCEWAQWPKGESLTAAAFFPEASPRFRTDLRAVLGHREESV